MKRYTPVPLAFICVQPEPETKCKDEPPIIFLHGVTGSKLHWQDIPQVVANATGRKAYVIDARNHGDSEWCDEFNFDCNSDDLLHFMDYIRAPKAALVGHSMGGKTAIKAALTAPERIDKLVVEDMFVKKIPQYILDLVVKYVEWTKDATELVSPDADESTAKDFIEDYAYEKLPEEYKTPRTTNHAGIHLKRKSDGRYYHSCNLDAIAKALKNYYTLMAENTGEYHGPSAFIYGELSPFLVRQDEENIKKAFPNAEFIKIENANHDIHGDFPVEFTKALLEFLMK